MFTVILPPHHDLPLGGDSILGPQPGEQLRLALTRLESEALDASELATCLAPVAESLAGLAPEAEKVLQKAQVSEPESRQASQDAHETEGPGLQEQYALYDDHFGLRRRRPMSWTELSAQLLVSGLRLLQDLPRTLLSRGQLHALLLGLERMLGEVGGERVSSPGIPVPLPGDRAEFRWRNGHHVFGMANLFGRMALERAAANLDQADLELERAIVYLRFTGAAMAYATDFPSEIYLNRIRPSMVSAAMPGGFSGSQNADYNHFKRAKGWLVRAVVERFGGESSAWPTDLVLALKRFRTHDELDLDTHILLAAEKIGLQPSLKQTAQQDPDSAVKALRRIQAERAREFPLP